MKSTNRAHRMGSGRSSGLRARLMRIMLSAVLAAASLPVTSAPAASAANAPAAPLSCSGGTIYSYQKGASSSSTGSVYALNTATVGQATVAATLVTTVPAGGNANALGITKGGTAMYAVDQTTTAANSAIIHGYDTTTQSWTTYTGGGSGASSSFVAGAVDPANGIYYYVSYGTGTSSSPGTATMYGFNTVTNTRISGTIATFSLPTGNSSQGNNGDIAFDTAGNMYVLASNSTVVGIGVVKGPMPTTGSATGVVLTDTLLNRFNDTNTYNGIAFDNAGNLYVSGGSGAGDSVVTKLNPNTGSVIAGPTMLSSNAQTFFNVDLAACSLNPTLSLQKDVVGRYVAGDQFTLSITGGGIRDGNTATTTGNATGVQAEVAGPVIAQSGTTYTLAETAASGSLLNYSTTYACVDTANGNAPVASGTGQSFTLKFPDTTSISPNVVCTFTNTPLAPGITLKKTVAESTVSAGGTLHYSYLVKNTGNVTLAPVTIHETEFTGHGTPPSVTCPPEANSLAPSDSVTCTATYTATQADVDAGSVSNTATASGKTPAGDQITSAPSTVTVPAVQSGMLSLVKSAEPGSFDGPGQTITYTFKVGNTGNVTLHSVAVADELAGLSAVSCLQQTLAPGAGTTCSATYVTTAADVDAGSVVNTATVHARTPADKEVASAPSTVTVPAVQSAPTITTKLHRKKLLLVDTATLTGTGGVVTGTVSFFLCPHASFVTGCPQGRGFLIPPPVKLVNGSATSAPFGFKLKKGTYCVGVQYRNDGNSPYVDTYSGSPKGECFRIGTPPPPPPPPPGLPVITTHVSKPIIKPGGSLTDTARLTGSMGTVTGTVDFLLCSHAASGCPQGSGRPVQSGVRLVNGLATSAPFGSRLRPGHYCVGVLYHNDGRSRYADAYSGSLVHECFTVVKHRKPVIIITRLSRKRIVAGGRVRDFALLKGVTKRVRGVVGYRFYRTLRGCWADRSRWPARPRHGLGAGTTWVHGPIVHPSRWVRFLRAGTYYWVAFYSGDTIHAPAASRCRTEVLWVRKRHPCHHAAVASIQAVSAALKLTARIRSASAAGPTAAP